MKSLRIVPLLALAVSVVGFAIAVMNPWTFGSRGAAAGLSAAPPPSARSEDLTEESREANARLTSPGPLPADARRSPVTSEGEDSEASEGTFAEPGEPPKAATLEELLEFREYVRTTLSEIRKEEAADKLRELKQQVAKLDETMPALEDWLELTPQQSDKMRSVLLTQWDREAEYLRLWEQGADEEILGELKVSDQKAHSNELAGFLTEEQVQTYLRGGQ